MEPEKTKQAAGPVNIDVVGRDNEPAGSVELSGAVFGAEVKPHLLHEVVVYQESKHRSGTASSKTRGEVAASNRKPWRQKGTGRARSGRRSSPIWTGGGTIFGPHPRDYGKSVPKKVRRAALRSAISARREEGNLVIVDELKLDEPKTKLVLEFLEALGVGENALLVIAESDRNVELAARNLPKVKAIRAEGINVRDVLLYKKLVMTRDAALKIQEALA